MSEFAIGDKVRLSPTSPNIRLANRVGEQVGTIVASDAFKAWIIHWFQRPDFNAVTSAVHEHEIEKVTDDD